MRVIYVRTDMPQAIFVPLRHNEALKLTTELGKRRCAPH